jgi:hypothetical protein
MWIELLLRFLAGGAMVSAFAAVGEVFKPKTFAGLFGAAPSVALATLALTFARSGAEVVRVEGRSMVLGAAAFFAYGVLCVAAAKRPGWPVWRSAGGAWLGWFIVAVGLWRAGELTGMLR